MAEPQRPRLITTSDTCTVEDEQGQHTSFPKYRHSPLPPGRTIRLLKVQSQTQPWPLSRLSSMNEFSLVEYELESTDVARLDVSASPYVALSYSWGKPVFDAPLVVIVQGQRTILPVTASAWEAVQRTLPAIGMHGKAMWIDQICINQTDEQEKAEQVMLMGDIYRRCWHCLIWLGPVDADADTQAAFSLFRRLDEAFRPDRPIPIDQREIADLSHAQIRAKMALKVGKDRLPAEIDPGWTELAKLLQRSWFTRLWTFQEAVLCYKGDASVRCGIYNTSVITLMRASMFLGNDHTFAGINFSSSKATLAQISTFRYHVEHGQVTPLIWLLQNNNLRNCFNPRDRIYAFLGVRKEDGPEYPIQVDYQKTPADLFTEIARKIIQSQASLRICADAPERVQENGLSDLPSWVPDWTKQPVATTFEWLNPSGLYFKTSNGRVHVDRLEDPRVLTVEGKEVDRVAHITDTEVPDAVNEEKRRKALVDEVLPLLLATLRSREPKSRDASLAHTIVNTIAVGGYTRRDNLWDFGLQPDAWSESICGDMLSYILTNVRYPAMLPPQIDPGQWLHALTRQAIQCANRRFAVLEHNLLGLVPKMASIGDKIVILHGSSLPFVLRPAGNGCFKLIGACFVDKIMHGERVDWASGDEFRIC